MKNDQSETEASQLHDSVMDFSTLRREGIHQLEQLIGQVWTDFNAHDPGITILEQACYAITDLTYRMGFELPDLLAEGGEDWAKELYRPSEVLTSHPVTLTDLRKLVMDVDGVKNAWVERVDEQTPPLYYHPGKKQLSITEEPLASQQVKLKGLYRVWIEKDLADIDGDVIKLAVTQQLQAHRGLCEDFESIKVLSDLPIRVAARIEMEPVEDAETLMVDIYQRLADYISPPVPFHDLQAMRDAGKPIDEIFEGPQLDHGFIDSQALETIVRREALHCSDLIREIMTVPGVRAVRHIAIGSGDQGAWSPWVLKLTDSISTPKLDLHNSEIVLQREQREVGVDTSAAIKAYRARLEATGLFKRLSPQERDILPPKGRRRQLSHYHSIQHQFPQVYGIGPAGLSPTASPQRRAQARQLKAYLLFFDQLLANLFAQLAHAGELFSFSGGTKTYFSKLVDDPDLDLETLRRLGNEFAILIEGRGLDEAALDEAALEQLKREYHRELLQSHTENTASQGKPGERRNRFLNHLLARFSEQFNDYSLMHLGANLLHEEALNEQARGEQTAADEQAQRERALAERLIADKEAFLQRYPAISSARGSAFNYLTAFGSDNRSGLEQRIRLKLGLVAADGEVFYLVEHILLRAMNGDQQQAVPFLAESQSRDPFSLQLSFVFANWPARFKNPAFRQLIEQTVRDETPAHLTAYTHWLGKAAMGRFETAYSDWLEKLRRNGISQ